MNIVGDSLNKNSKVELKKDVMPQVQLLVEDSDSTNKYSGILNKDLVFLLYMDIDEIKANLVVEIKELDKFPEQQKKLYLKEIFSKLLKIQPLFSYPHVAKYEEAELRLYVDLISMTEIYDDKDIREFLKDDSNGLDKEKRNLLLKIYNYYDNHPDLIDKFNYILSSSSDLVRAIINKNIDLEKFFSERVMSLFDKEDLSQMFREYYSFIFEQGGLKGLFDEKNDKVLFMISKMAEKVKSITGHSSEFLEIVFKIYKSPYYRDNFVNLLNDYYVSLVGNKDNENDFSNAFLNLSGFIEVDQLINYIMSSYFKNDGVDLKIFASKINFTHFINFINNIRIDLHHDIFKDKTLDKGIFVKIAYRFFDLNVLKKIKNGNFDVNKDFKEILGEDDLYKFKNAFLQNVYGISMKDTEYILEVYSKYIDEFEKCVKDDDREILEVLKSIKNIYDLDYDSDSFNNNLKSLQMAYYYFIKDNGSTYQNSIACPIIIEGLLNRMVINTYNQRVFKVDESCKILKIDDGVKVVDAGLEFDMILTSLSGDGYFYANGMNMVSKWNSSYGAYKQGLSASHISNENLGVISTATPLLGFSNIPEEALNGMGPCDIFSDLDRYDLRGHNRSMVNNLFIPATIMSNETRYGYNELVLDRFLMRDSKNILKLQPDYIVFYKMNDESYNKERYLQCKKMACEFDIPIVLVDVEKIKNHEKQVIEKMEEELFASTDFNKDLLSDIVTRYMNNYTGGLSLSGEIPNYEEFSVLGMDVFFDKLIYYIKGISDQKIKQRWIDGLVEVHDVEKQKYDYAVEKSSSYKNSVINFVLQEIGVTDEIDELSGRKRTINQNDDDENKDCLLINLADKPILKTMMTFINEVGIGSYFELQSKKDSSLFYLNYFCVEDCDLFNMENLIVSYFFENFDVYPIVGLNNNVLKFKVSNDFNFVESVKNSRYDLIFNNNDISSNLLETSVFEKYISKIEEIDDIKFIGLFYAAMTKFSVESNYSFNDISSNLLEKKRNIRENFNKLRDSYCDSKGLTSKENRKK